MGRVISKLSLPSLESKAGQIAKVGGPALHFCFSTETRGKRPLLTCVDLLALLYNSIFPEEVNFSQLRESNFPEGVNFSRGSQHFPKESTFPEGVKFSRESQLFPRESTFPEGVKFFPRESNLFHRCCLLLYMAKTLIFTKYSQIPSSRPIPAKAKCNNNKQQT